MQLLMRKFLLFFLLPQLALAQVEVVDDSAEGENIESMEGLESATPTDDVNELNANGSPNSVQPQGTDGNNFNFGDEEGDSLDSNSGDGFFGNTPSDAGNAAGKNSINSSTSAFGDGGNQSQKASQENQAKKIPPANTVNPVITDTVPPAAPSSPTNQAVNPAVAIPADVNGSGNPLNPAAPSSGQGNAQILMNQISNESAPVDPGTNPSAANNLESVASQKPPELPKAPPLPPPNEFSGAPPVPGTMRLMAEGEAPEEYFVQSGDTLFDICDQLLDEPGYWPKLWALNPEIKNPHFIFPNMRLRFYPGDDETPPYLQVVTEDDVIPIDKGDLDEEQLVAETVVFETESQVIEESQIEVIGPEGVDGDVEEFLVGGNLYNRNDIQVQVPGFIFRNEKDPLAYVIGGNHGEVSVGPGKKVLLESQNAVEAGTLYTILRKGEEIYDPQTGEFVGTKYYFIANARVQKKLDDAVYVALVENVRLSVMPEDIVVSFISTNRTIPATSEIGNLSAVNGNVVGFQFRNQEIGGMGNYAFLDKGNGEGISPGMYVPVYATPGFLTSAFGNADLPEDYELVGVLRIIDTTEAGAVGYIIQNTQELRVGDRTRKG